jgi:BlaI family penicillinase repressor
MDDQSPSIPPTPLVTDAELAVLQVIWERGTATTREVMDRLYPGGSSTHYGTVQKLLERLQAKGCVERDRSTWPHCFRALMDREALLGNSLRAVAEKLCGGSLTPLLTHLLNAEHLTAQERRELRTFLDRLNPEPRPSDRES